MVDPGERRVPYWPALDGLRALAILAVFVMHNGIWIHVSNGGYGVELFFVISGFLITTILLREHEQFGGIRLGRFWSRRLVRLYPALLALVATSVTYAALSHRRDLPGFHRLDTAPNIARSALPPLLYLTNFFLPQHHYFGGHFHLWSLAVEEQFYLVLPLVLIVVLKRRHAPQLLFAGVSALAVGCQLWRVGLYRYAYVDHVLQPSRWWFPKYVRVLIDVDRADTLLYGVLLALVVWYLGAHRAPIRFIHRWSLIGFAYVVGVITIGPKPVFGSLYYPHIFFGLAAAVVVGGVVLRPAGALARVLAVAPLAWMGRLSYSFYLWHFLIIRAFISDVQFGLGPVAITVLRFGLSMTAAGLSYAVVERPVRSWFNARHDTDTWPEPDPALRVEAYSSAR